MLPVVLVIILIDAWAAAAAKPLVQVEFPTESYLSIFVMIRKRTLSGNSVTHFYAKAS
jgi:hypothetical protein